MLPLSDGVAARRFPVVNVSLIVANFAVWIFYELPHLDAAVYHASFYPCSVDNACRVPEPWGVSWITAMFLHGSWDHILGNMLFLAIFGKNVEDAYGPLRYLLFYFAGGFAAMLAQTGMTLWFGTAADGRTANLGASGAIAAVLGAYFILYPGSKVTTWIFPVFVLRIPAWIYLGLWFLYQLIEADFGLFKASANGGGVAFFAHVGGFVFGVLATWLLTSNTRIAPQVRDRGLSAVGQRLPVHAARRSGQTQKVCVIPAPMLRVCSGKRRVCTTASRQAGRRRTDRSSLLPGPFAPSDSGAVRPCLFRRAGGIVVITARSPGRGWSAWRRT